MVLNRKLVTSIIFAGVIFSGCATSRMDVTVDVMDPKHARKILNEAENARFIRQSLLGDESHLKNELTHICKTYFEGRAKIFAASADQLSEVKSINPAYPNIDKKIANETNGKNEDIKRAGDVEKHHDFTECEQQIDHAFKIQISPVPLRSRALRRQHQNIICLKGQACDGHDQNHKISLYLRSIERFRSQAEQALKNFMLDQSRQTQSLSKATGVQSIQERLSAITQTAATDMAQSSGATSNSYLGPSGRTLVLTAVAYGAASAPEDVWEEEYNVARGIGVGGSTDTVIKLNDTADFTVKGLVFDARSTALMARKLTISSIQLLASGAGIPIRDPGTPQADGQVSGTDILDGNDQIIQAKADIQADAEKRTSYRSDLRRIALSTLYTAEKIDAIAKGGALASGATAKDLRTSNAEIVDITFSETK